MSAFAAKRVSHEFTQTNDAPPEKVFPLLCPVREADWVPGWQYRLIYSQSGVAEDGCVFTTPNETGPESIWMCTHYDPAAHAIAYAWVKPGMVAAQLRISLAAAPEARTSARIHYVYTALSPGGNAELERFTPEWFQKKMQGWESAINHYLRTGKLMVHGGWE
jgi:hypothetical protein